MRALVIEHDEHGGAEKVGEKLISLGFHIESFRVLDDLTNPVSTRPFPEPQKYDLLVVMGSTWSVNDQQIESWITREIEMVRSAHDSGVKVLGICFGGQVLSKALGGHVERASQPEIGWHEVKAKDPESPINGLWFQWHYDKFSVPDCAEGLAESETCTQAFVSGSSLGIQFHPEVSSAQLEKWIVISEQELIQNNLDASELLEATKTNEAEAFVRSESLLDWYLADLMEK